MTIGPIPHNFVKEYGRDAGLDEDNLAMFVGVMRDLDAVYLEDLDEQRKINKPVQVPTKPSEYTESERTESPRIRSRVVSGAR